jgi:ABC-type transport system involved in Fe-S cluster assembly fused permease/ATPase subunit
MPASLRPSPQVLFNDTIRYNIRYAKPHASDEEVRRLCC